MSDRIPTPDQSAAKIHATTLLTLEAIKENAPPGLNFDYYNPKDLLKNPSLINAIIREANEHEIQAQEDNLPFIATVHYPLLRSVGIEWSDADEEQLYHKIGDIGNTIRGLLETLASA